MQLYVKWGAGLGDTVRWRCALLDAPREAYRTCNRLDSTMGSTTVCSDGFVWASGVRAIMARQITQYRVFIGSPGGLADERKAFRDRLGHCSKTHGEPKKVQFEPIGWEDTVGGCGRPQEQINRDLEECDYAVFVFHDRWGTTTGKDGKVGTEEEWELAEKLWDAKKIRNIVLFFKTVDPAKLADPGKQLEPVLAFRKRIEEGKRHLFHAYKGLDEFRDRLDTHLARWLDTHEQSGSGLSTAEPSAGNASSAPPARDPGHAFWIAEARAARKEPNLALHFADRAAMAAETDGEWADARILSGIAKFDLGIADEAIAAFEEVVGRLAHHDGVEERRQIARALFDKGVALSALDRIDDAIAAYDDVLARFTATREPAIREWIAKVLLNKGVVLRRLGRSEDAIAVYDETVTRFGAAREPAIREQVAKALVNKGVGLEVLGRSVESIAVYDDVVTRFAAEREPVICRQVAKALVNKGVMLGALGRSDEEIAVYDNVDARFATAGEPAIRGLVAEALVYKGHTLGALGRNADAIAVYDDLLARFGREPSLAEVIDRAKAAKARLEKAAAPKRPKPSKTKR